MIDISPYCHLQGTGQCLENALYLVVLVLSLSLDVEVHPGSIAQTLEEVQEHLCRHFTDSLAMELSVPYQPGASSKVERHLTQAVVHRQTIAITLNAALVA